MARSSKNFLRRTTKLSRRLFAKPVRELSRTGKIIQTLWDAAQLQSQQRAYYQKIGEIAIKLAKNGELNHMGIARIVAKIEQIERILNRQELIMRGYQDRTDVRKVLREERKKSSEQLEPV